LFHVEQLKTFQNMTTNWINNARDYYKHEPLSIYVVNIAGGGVTVDNVTIDGTAYTFSAFHSAINGTLTIDLSDLALMATNSFSFRLTDTGGNKTLTATRAGNANPLNFVAPPSPQGDILAPYLNDSSLNFPLPSMVIQGEKICAEYIYDHEEVPVPVKHIADDSEFGIFVIEDGVTYFVWSVNGAPDIYCLMRPQECGVRYWRVDWVSRTGKTKRHYWEVVKVTESTAKTQEIDRLDRQYDVRKNKLVSVTLRLRNLNAYDLWYYSDIVTSNLVEATNDNGITYRVNVTTKKVTTPDGDGGKLNTLEIDLEYLNYVAI